MTSPTKDELDAAVREAFGSPDFKGVMTTEQLNAVMEDLKALTLKAFEEMGQELHAVIVAQVAAAESRLNERINGMEPVALRDEFMAYVNTARDSMIAANHGIVIDMNSTFRGIHARLVRRVSHDALELPNNPRVMTVMGNMAQALRDTAAKLGDY